MRDNDTNPIPDSSEVAEVKAIIDDTIKPANTDTLSVIVLAPDPIPTDFHSCLPLPLYRCPWHLLTFAINPF